MSEHMDLDCSGVLRREYDLTSAGGRLMESWIAQSMAASPAPRLWDTVNSS